MPLHCSSAVSATTAGRGDGAARSPARVGILGALGSLGRGPWATLIAAQHTATLPLDWEWIGVETPVKLVEDIVRAQPWDNVWDSLQCSPRAWYTCHVFNGQLRVVNKSVLITPGLRRGVLPHHVGCRSGCHIVDRLRNLMYFHTDLNLCHDPEAISSISRDSVGI